MNRPVHCEIKYQNRVYSLCGVDPARKGYRGVNYYIAGGWGQLDITCKKCRHISPSQRIKEIDNEPSND